MTALMAEMQNLIVVFETLATGKTLDDAYLLVEDLGYKDKIILVGHKGLTTLARICTEPDWAKQPMEKILIRFRGGPETGHKKVFTASVRSYVVDRLVKTVIVSGIEPALEAIKTIWGINVYCGASIDDPILSNI